MLGPTFNPKKYEGITRTTIKAGHSGRFLGLLNGGFLGLALGGDSDFTPKAVAGLATVGSITLGELGFQLQKRSNLTDGYIGMMGYYGIIGPYIAVSLDLAAGLDNTNLIGASLLAGGVGGLLLGDRIAKNYDYTGGDASVISSLGLISIGIGFSAVINQLEDGDSNGFFIVPALAAVAGTAYGQSSVKGVRLTKKQGSNINLATAGAAAIGLGVATLVESESPAVWLGIPSGFALITHQLLFYRYKNENSGSNDLGYLGRDRRRRLSLELKPENYFVNRNLSLERYAPEVLVKMEKPVISLRLDF